MANAKGKGPSAAKAAKAAAEKDRTVEWQGLTLTVPDEPPESLIFDIVEMEANDNGVAVLRMLRSILGPEQFTQVRYKFEELGENSDSESLFEKIFGALGLTPGESSASSAS